MEIFKSSDYRASQSKVISIKATWCGHDDDPLPHCVSEEEAIQYWDSTYGMWFISLQTGFNPEKYDKQMTSVYMNEKYLTF